jgi:hypothetical protein
MNKPNFSLPAAVIIVLSIAFLPLMTTTAQVVSPPPKPASGSLDYASYKLFYGTTSYTDATSNYLPHTKIMATFAVSDPAVPHKSSAKSSFFFAYIGEHQGSSRYIDVGWSECSWQPNKQLVTVYDSQHNTWLYYPQYNLMEGQSYTFQLTYQANGAWQAWINWNSNWQLLTTARIDVVPSSQSFAQEGFTVYSAAHNWFKHNWFNIPSQGIYDVSLFYNYFSGYSDPTVGAWQPWTQFNYLTPYGTYGPYYFWTDGSPDHGTNCLLYTT